MQRVFNCRNILGRTSFSSDNSIESFFDDEWHNVGTAKVNKKNKNFIISDGDACLFGFLSDNGSVLFAGEGIPLLQEKKASQPIWESVYSSNNIQIKLTENHSLEVSQHDGAPKNIGDVQKTLEMYCMTKKQETLSSMI